MEEAARSVVIIENGDLERLAKIAREERLDFFSRHERWRRLYADRIVCVALCQGAALHFVDGKTGVNDFDVYTFYAEHSEAPFPPRRRIPRDYGPSKFGRNPEEKGYTGRRVDLMARSIRCQPEDDPVLALQSYLTERRTQTSRSLAQKAVVLIDPVAKRGTVIWPTGKGADRSV